MMTDQMLGYHLQYNHYPPLPLELVPLVKRVIKHSGDCVGFDPLDWGVCNHKVLLPKGMSINDHRMMRVWDVVEMCHLDDLLPRMDNRSEQCQCIAFTVAAHGINTAAMVNIPEWHALGAEGCAYDEA